MDITNDELNQQVRTPLSDVLNLKSSVNHNYDLIEITKTTTVTNEEEEEVELLTDLLDGKASINHSHDSSYSLINHNHDSSYLSLNQNHDSSYLSLNHNPNITEITKTSTIINEEE